VSELLITNPSTPLNEEDIILKRRWLAGIFEAGGSMGISAHSLKRYGKISRFSGLFSEIKNSDWKEISEFHHVVGGREPKPKDDITWRWRTGATGSLQIGAAIYPFAPSRREIIKAFDEWALVTTPDKLEIAKRMKGNNRFKNVSATDYLDLVEDPEFLAGVIDMRGSPHTYLNSAEGSLTLFPRITVCAKRPLLEALKEVYGGYIIVRSPNDSPRNIKEASFIAQGERLAWHTSPVPTRKIVQITHPHIVMTKEAIADLLKAA
jgi:hypothetical protein